MDIDRIEIYSKSGKVDETVEYIRVFYEDESIEDIYDFTDICAFLARFDKPLSELLEDKDMFKVIKIVKTEEKPEERIEEKPEKGIVVERKVEEKNTKEKTTKEKVKTGAIIALSGLVLFGSLYALLKKGNSLSNQKTGTPKEPDKTIEQQVNGDLSVYRVSHGEPVVDNGSNYLNNLNNGLNSGTIQSSASKLLALDEVTPSVFYNNLDNINLVLAANMNEVCNLMDGGRMTGDEFILTVNYNNNSYDSIVLQEFVNLRNDMVHNAYQQSQGLTSQQIKLYLDKYLDFAFNGEPVNGIYWNEVNPMVRYIVTFMGMQMLGPNTNYSHTINGTNCDRRALQEGVNELFATTVMDNLLYSVSTQK